VPNAATANLLVLQPHCCCCCSPDLCHLLAHASHVIVAHLIKLLLILTLDGLAFTEDLCSSSSKPEWT
jgi:hypothetical protein